MILICYLLDHLNIVMIEYFIFNLGFIPINNIQDHLSINFIILNYIRIFIF
jgi:hypothetical protein